MTATPWGFRDILPEEAQAREEIACTVKGCFREHHYLPVETPLLEDKGSLEEGGRIADTPFKLFDDDGRKLALPDARIIAGGVRPFKELLAACEDHDLATEALRCVHANDFVGLDARVAASAEGPLRIAVPKGSLKADTLDVLEAAGQDVSELRYPGRHLIERGCDTRAGEGAVGDIEFVIVRPSDAPASLSIRAPRAWIRACATWPIAWSRP